MPRRRRAVRRALASDREGLTRGELLGIAAALVLVAAAVAAIVYWISTSEWSVL